MFSVSHLIWIAVCTALIAVSLAVLLKRRPPLDRVMKVCLCIAVVSEFIKIGSVIEIVPMVDPVIEQAQGTYVLSYIPTGEYTPMMGVEHLPLELCSLQIFFIAIGCFTKSKRLRHSIYALIYPTGVIGGVLGIVMATVTAYISTPREYFLSPRIWQYFLYHAMIVVLALYIGRSQDAGLVFSDWKIAVNGLIFLDIPTIYLNSLLSSRVYQHDQLVGVTHRINFFSSYVNPLGLILTSKWQWLLYLLIRAVLAFGLMVLFFVPLRKRGGSRNV
ncbi:Integral membrane protein (intg_mem_TP0381) [Ruminococcaceae bacterium YRB3002]|nr:Integral membrane protein (intg_mem_TP0381) [Ruminococcaceae bacterium YRB3002]